MKGWIAGLCLALASCAVLDPQAERLRAVDAVVAEAVNAARAPAPEQRAALSRAQEAFVGEATPLNRLRLATLLAALPAPLRDDARAAELLEPIADASAPGIGRFAALLASQIAERQRIGREFERATREGERVARERERLDKERERREEGLKQQLEALQQQLEALRSIERGILEREERLRGRQK